MKKLVALMLIALTAFACLAGCKKEPEAEKTYTYKGAFALSPSTFNPLTYKSTSDRVPLDYTTSGWYEMNYTADGKGFEYVPVMAAEDPIDVTATYASDATWTIPAGATTGYAFRIKLNRDAKWDDGTAITADDYVYTVQEQLNPLFQNYRGQDLYNQLGMVGAKDYLYQGKSGWFDATVPYETYDSEKEFVFTLGGAKENETAYGKAISSIRAEMEKTYASYFEADTSAKRAARLLPQILGLATTDTVDEWQAKIVALEGKKVSEIQADATLKATFDALLAAWQEGDDGILDFTVTHYTYPEFSFEKVGFKKIDDYTVDLILTKDLQGFYIKYSLVLHLVYKPLYESLKKQDPATGLWSTTYGTSLDTYIGYGPYKMTKYQTDQVMEFEKSKTWFGFTEKYADKYGTFTRESDGATVKQFQTEKIVLTYAKDISTREQMFLAGQLDVFGMNKAYYDKYKSSERLYSATGATTFYGIILSDYDSLLTREKTLNNKTMSDKEYAEWVKANPTQVQYNKTILTLKEFRKALCYGINRDSLVANLYPGGSPATSLFTDLILAVPDEGRSVNSYDETKAAICEFWGVEWGEGKEFATLDEAYKSIKGYDLTQAKKYIDEAYDKAIEQGLMGANTVVKIDYCASSDSESDKLWYETFKSSFDELMKGTKLEGKFQYDYNTSLGSDFGAAIQSGQADTSWGFGWSGGELDPYDLLQVYVDAAEAEEPYQYDRWIDRSSSEYNLTLKLDLGDGEKEYTYSVYDWYRILNGKGGAGMPNMAYGKAENALRAKVLAAVEGMILEDYTTIPMMNEGSIQLLTYKVNYGKETYMFGMGFGGTRYMTYNYDDAAWNKYVKSNGGSLKY